MKLNIPSIPSSEITPQGVFDKRRELIKIAAGGALGLQMSSWFSRDALAQTKLAVKPNPAYVLTDRKTSYNDVASYNNFYEFGTDKSEPAVYASSMITSPWKLTIEGLVASPKTFDIDDLMKLMPLEERVYRMRCVEGWSMVIPWVGYSLSHLLKQVNPLGSAKFIEFVTLADKKQMRGLSSEVVQWPYTEGLRLDEANHPLTLLTLGLYGQTLPNQNGAPVRIVIPWKYGFKSGKSIVKIRFHEKQPATSWNMTIPSEYGFYSNVNPEVNHPRWSQATERRISDDKGLFSPKIKTLKFNGYGDQVASLYAGMDLKKFY